MKTDGLGYAPAQGSLKGVPPELVNELLIPFQGGNPQQVHSHRLLYQYPPA